MDATDGTIPWCYKCECDKRDDLKCKDAIYIGCDSTINTACSFLDVTLTNWHQVADDTSNSLLNLTLSSVKYK